MGAPVATTTFLPDHQAVRQNWPRLADYLAGIGLTLDLSDGPHQFDSGFGNLNYRVVVNGGPAVLRRPPMGPIPPGGNDMVRESRILSRLWKAFPLAPRCLHACPDTDVLGAAFFIMEYRPGLVIGGSLPEELIGWRDSNDSPLGAVIGNMLVETLGALHMVDPAGVDLDTLGRPEGFLKRTTKGWAKRAELAWDGDTPAALADILRWLDANKAPEAAPTLLHNDFKLDNMILDAESLKPVAVIDWDMGTRGDPLLDLAVLLSYWTERDDPPVMHRLNQMPSAGSGFPSREEVANAYSARTGRDLSNFRFHRVLGVLRVAVVFMQLNRRYREGGANDERFATFGSLAEGLLEFALDVASERIF